MTDAIDNAVFKSSSIKPAQQSSPSIESTTDRIKKLPLVKTTELIERENEAAAQHSKADSDRSKLLQKEQTDVEQKKVIFTNNIQEYAKVQKFVEECVKINEVRSERVSVSSENVKKSKKSFTFPMKKKSGSNQPQEAPIVPDLPLKPFN